MVVQRVQHDAKDVCRTVVDALDSPHPYLALHESCDPSQFSAQHNALRVVVFFLNYTARGERMASLMEHQPRVTYEYYRVLPVS